MRAPILGSSEHRVSVIGASAGDIWKSAVVSKVIELVDAVPHGSLTAGIRSHGVAYRHSQDGGQHPDRCTDVAVNHAGFEKPVKRQILDEPAVKPTVIEHPELARSNDQTVYCIDRGIDPESILVHFACVHVVQHVRAVLHP